MKERLDKVLATPWIAHILRANTRYGNRLGGQFAAAITYFSVLALVPILMLAFSALGFALSTSPSLYDDVSKELSQQLGESVMNGSVGGLIKGWMKNWGGIGIVGAVSALYAGAGWVSNLKSAIRAQWRPEFDTAEDKRPMPLEVLVNMGLLLGLLLTGAATLAASALGTTLNGFLVSTLKLDTMPGAHLLTWLLGFVVTIVAGMLLFLFLYAVFPQERAPKRDYFIGCLVGSFGLALLQSLAGLLIGVFAKNKAAALFGPVIVLMLSFNLFAQLCLRVAAWIATTDQPAIARKYTKADAPLMPPREGVNAVDGHWEAAEQDRVDTEAAKEQKKQAKVAKDEANPWKQ